jgi:hypothetical protein
MTNVIIFILQQHGHNWLPSQIISFCTATDPLPCHLCFVSIPVVLCTFCKCSEGRTVLLVLDMVSALAYTSNTQQISTHKFQAHHILVITSVVWVFDLLINHQFPFSNIFKIKESQVLVFWEKIRSIWPSVLVIAETSKNCNFHERTHKEPSVRKLVFWIFQTFLESRFYAKIEFLDFFTLQVSGYITAQHW